MKKLRIHFVGIKGVGMTPLAIIAKEAGFTVSGSDIEDEFITDPVLKRAGIVPYIGFSKEHVLSPDLVIITGAHNGFDNVETKEAQKRHIKVITQGEAVGLFMNGEIFGKKFIGISIAGTHGKTTTTAMVATILKENKLDPSYIIGTGDVGLFGAPGHLGKGKYFVAEADEYATEPKYNKKAKFLWQFPKIQVITNIEFDHPDIYSSIDDIRKCYLEFSNQLPKNGILIACGDDREVKKLLKDYQGNVISYGFNSDNNYVLENVHISGMHMFFSISSNGMLLSDFMLKVVGEHNALNALASIIVSLECGLSIDKIKNGLLTFNGSKRRLEFIGELLTGAKVYDDYAHHPTEIRKTLTTLRKQYPNKKIVSVFQPHTYSRTKTLFNEFSRAFDNIEDLSVIVSDIYASLREQADQEITAKKLVDAIMLSKQDVQYLSSLDNVIQYINQKRLRSDTILVTMGAGDIYKIHSQLKFA